MDIDLTFAVQLGLLILLVATMRPLVFAPLLAVIDSRDQKIHGTRAEAARLGQLSAADREAYDARMQEARRQGLHERERLRQAGREAAERILADARQAASRELLAARERIGQASRHAEEALAAEVEGMAELVVARVLGSAAAPTAEATETAR